MTSPIEDKRGSSLKARQVSAELYTKPAQQSVHEEKKVEAPKKNAFEHITAEQYVKEYLKYNLGGAYKMVSAEKSEPPVQTSVENTKHEEKQNVCESKTVAVTEEKAAVSEPVSVVEEKTESKACEASQNVKAEEAYTESAPIEYRIVGEVFNSYVIVERGDTMLLIDKHAAHERIIFEQLKASMRAATPTSQLLLLPIDVMMTSEEIRMLSEYREELEAIGFEFSSGKYTLSVSAIPEGIETDAISDMLTIIAERIKENTGSARLTRDIIFEKALYQASCKAAIKAGREYAPEHIKWIVDKLMQIPDITFCPHGRPVAMEMSHKGLDRQFERC